MSIDRLFHSLAEDQGHRAICLLFSGTGTDGTLGLRSVKEHGGMAMAQSPESAKHDSILRSAIATGMVDHVLPPEEMPAKLVEYARLTCASCTTGPRATPCFEDAEEQLARICAHPAAQDRPRLQPVQDRRPSCAASSAGCRSCRSPRSPRYVDRLRHDPKEADAALPRPPDRGHPLLPRPGGLRGARARGLPASLRRRGAGADACGSGPPAAPRARRPIPSPSSLTRR